ncbi:hypothetical protein HF521_000203 [Silurus meridionalis]|uniref:Uncharacterized protein n=1 Tax=Silurus meridionalis TaxID=175797 RepID=A0A8T0BV83_SILME|nr:hypothetical protein HF521_000203 [Silurus meridionalis]
MSKHIDLAEKPPLDESIISRIIKIGGQALPGMVRSRSIPKSDQHIEREELSVQDDDADFMEWWLSEKTWKEFEDPGAEKDDAEGASFTVAALGFGVASFTASIFNNLDMDVDSMKLKMIFEDFTQIEEIEKCLIFISTHVECLKRYDLSTLKEVSWKTEKVVRMAHIFGDCVKVISAVSKCSGLIHGFMMGMKTNFGGDDSKQLGAKSRFAMQIRVITKQMEAVLDALMVFQTECSGLQRKTRSGNTCSATANCTGSIHQNGVLRGNHPQHCCI